MKNIIFWCLFLIEVVYTVSQDIQQMGSYILTNQGLANFLFSMAINMVSVFIMLKVIFFILSKAAWLVTKIYSSIIRNKSNSGVK